MKVFRDPLGRDEPPPGAVLTIGNFDGVHLGHRAVLEHVVARARELGVTAAAMVFDPHPIRLLRPSEAPPLICTTDQRLELMRSTGIEAVLVVPFTHKVARMEAARFVEEVIVGRLAAREVYIGANFRFGADRAGDVALLTELGARLGFAAAASPVVSLDGRPVSSTRIRDVIRGGAVDEAGRLLGRTLFVDGSVLIGKRLGRKLGFPTLNIAVENDLYPPRGVYVTAVHIPSFQRTFASVTNIGIRPTVYENSFLTVECHLLDFVADVYRERLRLYFLERLRDEHLFPSTIQLMAQIRRDVECARALFEARPISSLPLSLP